jgi:hypothetical protein
VINGALILDEMRRKPTPELTHAAPALVCHPRMLLFLESEPHTIFPSEWRLPQGGSLCQLRSPSVQEMLRSIRNDYFTPADLCERKVSHMLLHRLRQVLRDVDAAYVTVDVPLELRELASLFCFELFELHGTVLTWSFAELTEAQEHAVVKRLFGTRGVRLVGPRRRIYYKILMAIGGRRGASVIEFDLRTRILSIKVGAQRERRLGGRRGHHASGRADGGGGGRHGRRLPLRPRRPRVGESEQEHRLRRHRRHLPGRGRGSRPPRLAARGGIRHERHTAVKAPARTERTSASTCEAVGGVGRVGSGGGGAVAMIAYEQ